MSRLKDREKAIKLRKSGLSYSQIKEALKVSKSSLSLWLRDLPLSEERIRELRDRSYIRIEKTRETKRMKKDQRRTKVYEKVSSDIEKSSNKLFVSGFYLYWGEGTKTAEYSVCVTNTDPSIIRCFVQWMNVLGVPADKLKLKLHLYSDQDENEIKKFWTKKTGIPLTNFYKTYLKESKLSRKTYKGMFQHGTCVVFYHNRDVYEYVISGIKYLRNKHNLPLTSR